MKVKERLNRVSAHCFSRPTLNGFSSKRELLSSISVRKAHDALKLIIHPFGWS